MTDLFDIQPYNGTAGHNRTDTSTAAAIAITPKAATLRSRVYDALYIDRTGEEIAELLEKNLYSVLPRLTEMKQVGLVRDTGSRRATLKCGSLSIVWGRVSGVPYAERTTPKLSDIEKEFTALMRKVRQDFTASGLERKKNILTTVNSIYGEQNGQ